MPATPTLNPLLAAKAPTSDDLAVIKKLGDARKRLKD